jgi:hypothetical protein
VLKYAHETCGQKRKKKEKKEGEKEKEAQKTDERLIKKRAVVLLRVTWAASAAHQKGECFVFSLAAISAPAAQVASRAILRVGGGVHVRKEVADGIVRHAVIRAVVILNVDVGTAAACVLCARKAWRPDGHIMMSTCAAYRSSEGL